MTAILWGRLILLESLVFLIIVSCPLCCKMAGVEGLFELDFAIVE